MGIQPRRPIRVVEVANLVTQAVQYFRALAVVCLDKTSTPQRDAIGIGVGLVAWEDVPRACGFNISRPGGRGRQRPVSVEEKLEQQREYTAHQLWAATCGEDAAEWGKLVEQAGALRQKRLDREALPPCICPAETACTTHRQHAVLMCRVAGLMRAAKEAGRKLGGDVWAAAAGDEMSVILELTQEPLRERREAVPAVWRRSEGLALDGTWRGGKFAPELFEVWLRSEGARRMEQAARWVRMSDAAAERKDKSCQIGRLLARPRYPRPSR